MMSITCMRVTLTLLQVLYLAFGLRLAFGLPTPDGESSAQRFSANYTRV